MIRISLSGKSCEGRTVTKTIFNELYATEKQRKNFILTIRKGFDEKKTIILLEVNWRHVTHKRRIPETSNSLPLSRIRYSRLFL